MYNEWATLLGAEAEVASRAGWQPGVSDVWQARFIPKIYDFDEEYMAFIMEAPLGSHCYVVTVEPHPAYGESA